MLYNKEIWNRHFCFKGKYWYKNILTVPSYLKSIHYLVKNGYDVYATWETFDWFIQTFKKIFVKIEKTHISHPTGMTSKEWENLLNEMVFLLKDMDEENPKYSSKTLLEINELQTIAKNKFFTLFSKYFYTFWD